MGFWGSLGRVGLAIGTGGISEAARAVSNASGLGDKPQAPNLTPYDVSKKPGQAIAANYAGARQAPRSAENASLDMGAYNHSLGDNANARAAQVGSMDMLRSAAEGNAPSAAEMQMRSGLDSSMRQQLALANSAHGGIAAQAAAQRAGAQGSAQAQQQIVGQAGALRAQEMAEARNGYASAANGLRGADLAQLGTTGQQALGMGGLQNQIALGNLGAGVQADQLASQNQNAATQQMLDLERLKMQAQYGPQALQMQGYQADQKRQGDMWGGIFNAAGGIGAKLAG